jgi:hypothetical protein
MHNMGATGWGLLYMHRARRSPFLFRGGVNLPPPHPIGKVKLSRPQRPRLAAYSSIILEQRHKRTALQAEDDTMWMVIVQLPRPRESRLEMRSSSTLLSSSNHALRIPQRIVDDTINNSTAPSRR